MKIAAVEAIAKLARVEASEVVAAAYGGAAPVFGPDYIIPKPFDPRLILEIAPAVARAAIETGVARRPITDFQAYQRESGAVRLPLRLSDAPGVRGGHRAIPSASFSPKARTNASCAPRRPWWTTTIARPILLGRRDVIAAKVKEMGLRMDLGRARFAVLDPAADRAVFDRLIPEYQRLSGRRGTPPESAARRLRTRASVAAAMLLHAGQADAAICGGTGAWWRQIQYILPIIPRRPDVNRVYALSCLIMPSGVLFICDTFMVVDPTAEQITEMTLLAAEAVRGFGLTPKAALVSHSSFGASDSAVGAQDAARRWG